jgi:VanZ family protein
MNDPRNGFPRTWLLVLLWMVFIFILSSVPGPNIPDLPIPFFHKVVHFFEYAVLGVLWIRALTFARPGANFFKLSILAWGVTVLFALSDEWHQTFVPGRSGRLEDVLFDVICAVIGIVLYLMFRFIAAARRASSQAVRGDRNPHG